MVKCKDFVPKVVIPGGFFSSHKLEEFNNCLNKANQWIEEEKIDLINVETVVLPNIYDPLEEGSRDTNLDTHGDTTSNWNQFIRVWYKL